MDLKKVVFYIVSILLVAFAGLVFAGEIKLDIASMAQTLNIVPSKEETVKIVYEALKAGDETVRVQYVGSKKDIESFAKETVEEAFLIDDKESTDDFDYMKNKYRGYTAWISGAGIYTIHYEFDYSETKTQTDWVNERIEQILRELKVENKSEYEKIKKIHDYIIENTSYDLTVKYNSAYEGLKNNVTACQGYANMAYKMFEEAGVNCRIITGIADGEPHAWNIVQVGDVWYNIDCTWDDPIGGGKHSNQYDYFLKSNNDFKGHERDEEYRTEEFQQKYNMTDHSWK